MWRVLFIESEIMRACWFGREGMKGMHGKNYIMECVMQLPKRMAQDLLYPALPVFPKHPLPGKDHGQMINRQVYIAAVHIHGLKKVNIFLLLMKGRTGFSKMKQDCLPSHLTIQSIKLFPI